MTASKKDLSGLSNLDVRHEFQASVAAMKAASKELQKLPQNPHGKSVNHDAKLNASLNKVGANAGNDMSMFIFGAMEAGLSTALAGAAGVHLSGAASQGLDVATGMISESAEQKTNFVPVADNDDFKTGKARKNRQESVFKPKFKRAADNNNTRKPAAATMLMQASMKRQATIAFQNTAPKRKQLEKQLTEAESLAEVMAVHYLKPGIYDIYDSPEAKGQKVQTKRDGQIRLANPVVYNEHKQKQDLEKKPAARFAAPTPRFAA